MKRAFGDKLRKAFPSAGRPAESGAESSRHREAPAGEDAASLRDGLKRRFARLGALDPRPKVALPEGEEAEYDGKRCFVRRLRYPLTTQHGAHALSVAEEADPHRLAELAGQPAMEGFDLRRCLFLDTETTGLSGGAGTIVFMVGMGFFTEDAFVLEQTFLRCFSEEPAALTHTATRLREYPHLVTFVGKSFDRHRIAARMAVHKVRAQLFSPLHLDLYYMARRAWKGELPNVKLQTVESHKLGLHRTDDMPGSEAPQAFLDWIRDETGAVDRVFEHNRLDVLSLVTLLGLLGRSEPLERVGRGG